MTAPLLGLTAEDLPAAAAAVGVELSAPEARRVMAHLVSGGAADLDGMVRPIRKDKRAALAAHFTWARPTVLERIPDPADGSVRYLFSLDDGALVEAVRIPLHKPGTFTVCLSSQVGCAMRCVFCATGRLGLRRNLRTDEIIATFLIVRDEAPGPITAAVFMGQGEPLHNYEAVLAAAHILRHPCGGRVRAEQITLSTVGLVPQLLRYAAEKQPFRLIVSLTSATPERREALLPVAGRTPIAELAAALRALHAASGDRVTVAWVLIGGVNTGIDEAQRLQALLGDLPLRINLIDVNDHRPDGFVRAGEAERSAFIDALAQLGVPVVRRFSVGRDQRSACGMLAATRSEALAP